MVKAASLGAAEMLTAVLFMVQKCDLRGRSRLVMLSTKVASRKREVYAIGDCASHDYEVLFSPGQGSLNGKVSEQRASILPN
jgi:NADH dehydrogenase FAD-containing subunit